MDWTKFNNHGESDNRAFEVMCNLLFEKWCQTEYPNNLAEFAFINGAGGDGGIEAFATLKDGSIIGVQSKWFPDKLATTQITEIKKSFRTALKVRPNIIKYIVCVPRDLGSIKIGKGQKLVSNTEASRWHNLVEELKRDYLSVEVVLWDETTIQDKLTQPNAQGAFKFWFENSIVFDDQVRMSYEKAISSWADSKYIPEVYSFGYIHDRLERFLGSEVLSKRKYERLSKFRERLVCLKISFTDLLLLGLPEKEQELQKKIEQDIPLIEHWLDIIDKLIISARYGAKIHLEDSKFELNCRANDIKDSSLHFGNYFHFHEAETLLENIEDDFYYLTEFVKDHNDNRIIFLGNPGTGKSCGIVAETDVYLKDGSHLPILVNAKDFSKNETWSEIIEKTVGLSSTWSEGDLFFALENAALLRCECHEVDFSHEAKCVVCVDGIDEAESWEFWKRKIEEAAVYYKQFPRIRFVFLSRPYVFEPYYNLNYSNQIYHMPVTGDVSTSDLCDMYFNRYAINIDGNGWIKKLLRTPNSLRLFCELYQGKKINVLAQNTLVITNLYKHRIEQLEEKYNRDIDKRVNKVKLSSTLIDIAILFTEKSDISFSEIYSNASDEIKPNLQSIIDFLMEEGFIYSFSKKDDEFTKSETLYSWGSQPALDYLIAQKVFKALQEGIEKLPRYDMGIYQMLSIVLIENGKMPFEFPALNLNNNDMFEVVCYALANCSVEVAKKHIKYAKQLLAYSPAEFREIVENLILPVATIEGHPLGSKLLDEFLRSFKMPAERCVVVYTFIFARLL